jgi:four helix bundle protein
MGTEKTSFEKLRVYQLAEKLANEIWKIVQRWDHFAKDTLGKQIVRSGDSIGANIAEGLGRGSALDNRRFVRTARGSLNETKHWLRLAFQRRLLSGEAVLRLRPIVDELGPRLNAYLRSIDRRAELRTKRNNPQPTTHNRQANP